MTAAIIPFVSKADVDAAWIRFQDHVQRALDEPELLKDREFMEQWAHRERRFKKLFLLAEEEA
jgi:hypothetical protein